MNTGADMTIPKYQAVHIANLNRGNASNFPRHGVDPGILENASRLTHTSAWEIDGTQVEMHVEAGFARYIVRHNFGGDLREVIYDIVCWDRAHLQLEWVNINIVHRNTCTQLLSLPDGPELDKKG